MKKLILIFISFFIISCDYYNFKNSTNQTLFVGSTEVLSGECVELAAAKGIFSFFGDFPLEIQTEEDTPFLSKEEGVSAGHYVAFTDGSIERLTPSEQEACLEGDSVSEKPQVQPTLEEPEAEAEEDDESAGYEGFFGDDNKEAEAEAEVEDGPAWYEGFFGDDEEEAEEDDESPWYERAKNTWDKTPLFGGDSYKGTNKEEASSEESDSWWTSISEESDSWWTSIKNFFGIEEEASEKE